MSEIDLKKVVQLPLLQALRSKKNIKDMIIVLNQL